MTDREKFIITVDAAREVARRHAYSLAKAERTAQLDDRGYKRYDSRGLHAFSVEAGRLMALNDLMSLLGATNDVDAIKVRKDATEDSTAEWRERVFADFLPAVEDEPEESGGITDTSTSGSSSTLGDAA